MKVNMPPSQIRKRGRPSVDRTDEILDAAQQLYERIGFEKTTISDVARELGMSPANLYRTFPNRQAIDAAVARRVLTAIEDKAWLVARQAHTDPESALIGVAVTVCRESRALMMDDGNLNRLPAAAAREGWEVVGEYMDSLRGAIRHIIHEGQSKGIFAKGDIEELTLAIVQSLTRVWHPHMLELNAHRDLETDAARLGRFAVAALKNGINDD